MLKIACAIIIMAIFAALNLTYDHYTYGGKYYPTMILVYLFVIFALVIIGVHSYKVLRNKTKKP